MQKALFLQLAVTKSRITLNTHKTKRTLRSNMTTELARMPQEITVLWYSVAEICNAYHAQF